MDANQTERRQSGRRRLLWSVVSEVMAGCMAQEGVVCDERIDDVARSGKSQT